MKTHPILTTIALSLTIVILATRCANASTAGRQKESKLVGTWLYLADNQTIEMTFYKSHLATCIHKVLGAVNSQTGGEWHLDGNTIVENSNGKITKEVIAHLDADTLVIRGEGGSNDIVLRRAN